MIDLPEPFKKNARSGCWEGGEGRGEGYCCHPASRLPGESDMMIAGGQMKLLGVITQRRYVRKC